MKAKILCLDDGNAQNFANITLLINYISRAKDVVTDTSVSFCSFNDIKKVYKSASSKNNYVFLCNDIYKYFTTESSEKYELCDIFPDMDCHRNNNGDILGFSCSGSGCTTYITPDSESLLYELFSTVIYPRMYEMRNNCTLSTKYIVYIRDKAKFDNNLNELKKINNLFISVKTDRKYADIQVIASAKTDYAAKQLFDYCGNLLVNYFGDDIVSTNGNSLPQECVRLLKQHGMKVSTAESCTAGLLSSMITDVPNSSEVFEIGLSAYANRIKIAALGVSADTIKMYGAVSYQTAKEMSFGILNLSDSDVALSVTGVAGPSKSEGKEVGTVYVSLADNKNKVWVLALNCGSELSRDDIRYISAYAALDLLRRYLISFPNELEGGCNKNSEVICLSDQPNMQLLTFSVTEKEIETVDAADIEPEAVTLNETEKAEDEVNNDIIRHNIPSDEYYTNQPNAIFADENVLVFAGPDKSFTEDKPLIDTTENYFKEKVTKFSLKNIKLTKRLIATLLISLVAVFSISFSLYAVSYFSSQNNNQELLSKAQSLWSYSEQTDSADNVLLSIKTLRENINNDTYGWINIENTTLNCPIMLYKDNNYYKNHNIVGKKSRYGSLYFDFNTVFNGQSVNKNTVIYGNNMSDDSMFGILNEYKNINFLKNNSEIKFTNPYVNYNYKIFGVIISTDNPKLDNGNVFNYSQSVFSNEMDFLTYIANVKQRSIFKTNFDIDYNDEIITLVTDTTGFDDAKIIIVAVKTNSKTGNVVYTANPSPRYPQIWYDNNGTANPFINSVIVVEKPADNTTVSDVSEPENEPETGPQAPTQDTTTTGGAVKPSTNNNQTKNNNPETKPQQHNTPDVTPPQPEESTPPAESEPASEPTSSNNDTSGTDESTETGSGNDDTGTAHETV